MHRDVKNILIRFRHKLALSLSLSYIHTPSLLTYKAEENSPQQEKFTTKHTFSALCAQTRRFSRCKHCLTLHSFAKKKNCKTRQKTFNQQSNKASPSPNIKHILTTSRPSQSPPRLPFCPFNLLFFSFAFKSSLPLMSEHYYYYFPQLHIFFHIYTTMQQ